MKNGKTKYQFKNNKYNIRQITNYRFLISLVLIEAYFSYRKSLHNTSCDKYTK